MNMVSLSTVSPGRVISIRSIEQDTPGRFRLDVGLQEIQVEDISNL